MYNYLYLSYFNLFKKFSKEEDPETSTSVLISTTITLNIVVIYNTVIGLKQTMLLSNSKIIFFAIFGLLIIMNSKYYENIYKLNEAYIRAPENKIFKMRLTAIVHITVSFFLLFLQ